MGAKKVVTTSGVGDVDFEEAEKRAREEAERIQKLGYDPHAEEEQVQSEAQIRAAQPSEPNTIVSPTPISPPRTSSVSQGRGSADMERLGMGVSRLGFGQVGGGSKPAAAAAPRKMGFGSVGATKATTSGKLFPFFPLHSALVT